MLVIFNVGQLKLSEIGVNLVNPIDSRLVFYLSLDVGRNVFQLVQIFLVSQLEILVRLGLNVFQLLLLNFELLLVRFKLFPEGRHVRGCFFALEKGSLEINRLVLLGLHGARH